MQDHRNGGVPARPPAHDSLEYRAQRIVLLEIVLCPPDEADRLDELIDRLDLPATPSSRPLPRSSSSGSRSAMGTSCARACRRATSSTCGASARNRRCGGRDGRRTRRVAAWISADQRWSWRRLKFERPWQVESGTPSESHVDRRRGRMEQDELDALLEADEIEAPLPDLDETERRQIAEDAMFGVQIAHGLLAAINAALIKRP